MMLRKCVILLVAAVMLSCLSACGVPVNQTLPVFEDAAVIRSAWWCPEPTEENYQQYKDAGLNTLTLVNHNFWQQNDFWNSDAATLLDRTQREGYYIGTPNGFAEKTQTEKSLELAKKLGLSVILSEGSYLFDSIGQETNVYTDHTLNYGDYTDTIVGVFSGDEPSADKIADRAKHIAAAEQAFPNAPYFCNLYPMYASAAEVLKTNTYDEYLQRYGEEFLSKQNGPKLISVDYYPYQSGTELWWLQNFKKVAEAAKTYDADIHYYVQSCLHENGNYYEQTAADLRLQVQVALCFGASAYSYYLYDTAGTATSGYEQGLVMRDDTPSPFYGYAQEVNAEVAAMEDALLHYDYVSTKVLSGSEMDYQTGAYSILSKKEPDFSDCVVATGATAGNRALVSLFRDKAGNEAYYVVDFYDHGSLEREEGTSVTLQLPNMKQAAVYGTTAKLSGDIRQVENGVFTMELQPGEGCLIVPFVK